MTQSKNPKFSVPTPSKWAILNLFDSPPTRTPQPLLRTGSLTPQGGSSSTGRPRTPSSRSPASSSSPSSSTPPSTNITPAAQKPSPLTSPITPVLRLFLSPSTPPKSTSSSKQGFLSFMALPTSRAVAEGKRGGAGMAAGGRATPRRWRRTCFVILVIAVALACLHLQLAFWQSTGGSSRGFGILTPVTKPVAVCLVGGAREFDITGPSIMRNLIPAYSGAHVFLHSPLDENAAKLWVLADALNVDIKAIRIFPVLPVNASLYPTEILQAHGSPNGVQGLLQYFRLVEGCWDLITGHEAESNFVYNWIVRTRVDGYWSAPPPPLSSLDTESLTVPYGSNWGGVNDRFGVGGRAASEVSMRRLSMLAELKRTDGRMLSSERALLAQLKIGSIPISHANFSFCIASRRIYTNTRTKPCGGIFYSISSTAPMNGAKCRPCTPCLAGDEAAAYLVQIPPNAEKWVGPFSSGLDICAADVAWEEGWEALLVEAMGPAMAAQRREVLRRSDGFEICVESVQKLKKASALWSAPSPEVICMRRQMGSTKLIGSSEAGFNTFSLPQDRQTLVYSLHDSASQNASWERAMEEETGVSVRIINSLPNLKVLMAEAGFGTFDVLKVVIEETSESDLDKWLELGKPLPLCQLLVEFVDGPGGTRIKMNAYTKVLLEVGGLALDSCMRTRHDLSFRCTYFSWRFCGRI